MTSPEAIDATGSENSRGLPDPNTARSEALARLREHLELAGEQAKDEALDDLGLNLGTLVVDLKALQQFDRALVALLPENARNEAQRFLRARDASSLYAGSHSDIPF